LIIHDNQYFFCSFHGDTTAERGGNEYAFCMDISTRLYCWGDKSIESIVHDPGGRRRTPNRHFPALPPNENWAATACGTLAGPALKNRL
jgi:hypothetical protein